MPADPLDKQLVEAVLSRPRRGKAELEEAKLAGLRPSRASAAAVASDDDDDDDDDDLDLGPEALADDPDAVVVVVIEEDGAADPVAKLPVDAPAKLDADERGGADRRGAGRDRRRHDRHRRPGPDVPQGDRQGAAAERRGRGRPGQGHRARRADRRRAAEGASSRSGSGPATTPSARRAPRSRSTGCRYKRRGAPRSCGAPSAAEAAEGPAPRDA